MCEKKLETSTDGKNFVKEKFEKQYSVIKDLVHESGFESYKKQNAPLISNKNKKIRKSFYQLAKKLTIDDIRKIIFTDESSFEVFREERGKDLL